jgi:hypothetical protein
MGPPVYLRSVVGWNVVILHMSVILPGMVMGLSKNFIRILLCEGFLCVLWLCVDRNVVMLRMSLILLGIVMGLSKDLIRILLSEGFLCVLWLCVDLNVVMLRMSVILAGIVMGLSKDLIRILLCEGILCVLWWAIVVLNIVSVKFCSSILNEFQYKMHGMEYRMMPKPAFTSYQTTRQAFGVGC